MAKGRHRVKYEGGLTPEMLLTFLKTRANIRAVERHHNLGTWQHGKAKFGKASLRSKCQTCGMAVIIMPHGPRDEVSRRGTPSMRGEAVFETCQ